MGDAVDVKRLLIFLVLAFGLAWLVALVIYLTGGLRYSPELIPGSGISVALVLVGLGYMGAPALAHVLTRLISREGWKGLYLRPRRRSWPYWLAAWFLPVLMTVLGALVFFVFFPQYFDPSLVALRLMLAQAGPIGVEVAWAIVVVQTLVGVLIAPLVNGLFAFGEEFGWRAYLQPRLMALGGRRAVLLVGVIWGVWHWPVIAMGHNYGLEYPGAPWLGMLMMVWVTLGLGIFLGWLTIRSGNVWPAVIGHAAINGVSGLAAVCVQGQPNPLLGPFPSGIVASVAWALLALAILFVPGALEESGPESQAEQERASL